MAVWDSFLTESDKAICAAAGFGSVAGFGNRPAVLVVDVNYDFTGDARMPILESIRLYPTSCGPAGWNAIAPIAELLKHARANRIPTFFSTGVDYRTDAFDLGAWGHKNPRMKEGADTSIARPERGNDIVREIAPIASDIVIEKLKPSPFHGTPLLGHLVNLGVDTLLICGTTTSGCVRAAVIDAFSSNFKISIVEEGTFDRFESSHAINLFDMNAKYADVIKLEKATAYLDATGAGLYDDKIDFTRETAAR